MSARRQIIDIGHLLPAGYPECSLPVLLQWKSGKRATIPISLSLLTPAEGGRERVDRPTGLVRCHDSRSSSFSPMAATRSSWSGRALQRPPSGMRSTGALGWGEEAPPTPFAPTIRRVGDRPSTGDVNVARSAHEVNQWAFSSEDEELSVTGRLNIAEIARPRASCIAIRRALGGLS
jgi:hypothetical protein